MIVSGIFTLVVCIVLLYFLSTHSNICDFFSSTCSTDSTFCTKFLITLDSYENLSLVLSSLGSPQGDIIVLANALTRSVLSVRDHTSLWACW